MDTKKLRLFDVVARLGSFSQAATKLHIAQSAVSIGIKNLEQQLGLQLFDRSERQIRLTPEGERLWQHAQTVLKQLAAAERDMADMQNLAAGTVRFSTTAMLGSYFFPEYIQAFSQQYPEIDFQVVSEGTEGAIALLRSGEIDMGVINIQKMENDLLTLPLCEQPIVVCVSENHPLAGCDQITEVQFCHLPLIVYKQNYYLHQLAMALHQQHAQVPEVVLETDLLGMIITMVKQNFGVALGLQVMADAEAGIVGIPFQHPKKLPLVIACRKAQRLSLANQAFLDFLAQS
jgi:DNA-binding transcriptional LysR family regulator